MTPRLAIADRLLRLPGVGKRANALLVIEVSAPTPTRRSDSRPARTTPGCGTTTEKVPIDVLTAVVDGELVFATQAEKAVARASVTDAPDGTRWVGLSAMRVGRPGRRPGAVQSPAGVGGLAVRPAAISGY